MTLQDIINLTNAGYTKADITQLIQAEAPATPAAPAPAPATPAAPAPDPALSAIQSQIDTLKQMMQINNMLTVNQAGTPKERTIDDIFAEIINPPVLNKDNGGK